MKRLNISSGSSWEPIVGYSRAVRIGNIIEVSGTTASDGDTIVGENDAYMQAVYILQKIKIAIENAGGTINDVVRTRIYVTNISEWESIGKAHGEVFKEILPTTSMVEVSALIDPRMKLEIEATAIIESN